MLCAPRLFDLWQFRAREWFYQATQGGPIACLAAFPAIMCWGCGIRLQSRWGRNWLHGRKKISTSGPLFSFVTRLKPPSTLHRKVRMYRLSSTLSMGILMPRLLPRAGVCLNPVWYVFLYHRCHGHALEPLPRRFANEAAMDMIPKFAHHKDAKSTNGWYVRA